MRVNVTIELNLPGVEDPDEVSMDRLGIFVDERITMGGHPFSPVGAFEVLSCEAEVVA
jgi:hypothetical protein